MKRGGFPFASLLGLLLVGLAWAYLLGAETPRGEVAGVTLLADADGKPLSECDVYLTPATFGDTPEWEKRGLFGGDVSSADDPRERRHATTGKAGRFTLRGVPAGTYTLSASARWHSTSGVRVTVEEGKTASATLKLARSEAALSVSDHQATFTTNEKPFLPVRGYASLPAASASKAAAPALVRSAEARQFGKCAGAVALQLQRPANVAWQSLAVSCAGRSRNTAACCR